MKCRRTSNPISSSSFSLRSAANISFILLLSITSLFPPPANCQLLGSLMSMRGLGSLNPFAGLSSGLSGGGLLSSLRGGGGGSSSLFGSLTGSSSSIPGVGTGSMMSSFAPDIGTNIETIHTFIHFPDTYKYTIYNLGKYIPSNLLIRKKCISTLTQTNIYETSNSFIKVLYSLSLSHVTNTQTLMLFFLPFSVTIPLMC